MTILTIAQNIAMATGFSSPSALVDNTDEVAIQMLALIKEEVRALSDRFIWNALVNRATFNFVNGQEAYDLPTDFKDFVPNTIWNYSTRRPIIAPISSERFEIQKNYLISSGIDKMLYVYGNQMHITPTPSSTDTINYEYTTLNIYQDAFGQGKPDITADADVPTIREYLVQAGTKLRFMVAKGLISTAELQGSFEALDYAAQVQKAMHTDGFGAPKLSMSGGRNAWWLGAYTQDSFFPAS